METVSVSALLRTVRGQMGLARAYDINVRTFMRDGPAQSTEEGGSRMIATAHACPLVSVVGVAGVLVG